MQSHHGPKQVKPSIQQKKAKRATRLLHTVSSPSHHSKNTFSRHNLPHSSPHNLPYSPTKNKSSPLPHPSSPQINNKPSLATSPHPITHQRRSKSTSKQIKATNDDGYDQWGSGNFLLREFPTTSTKFSRKERDPLTGKVLKQNPHVDSGPTTWDFRSLFEDSFIEIQTKSKTQARTATVKDDDGNVIDDMERLASYPEGQLHQIALGLGEFQPKVPIDTKIQAKNLSKLLDTKLQIDNPQGSTEISDSKLKKKMVGDGSTTLELGDDQNAYNSLKNLGNTSHLYSGFLDPIELPTFITNPPLVNVKAARVLANKLNSKVERALAQGVYDDIQKDQNNSKNTPQHQTTPKHQQLTRQQQQKENEATREQALLWFARTSASGDSESSLQLAQSFEEILTSHLHLSEMEPITTLSRDDPEFPSSLGPNSIILGQHSGPMYRLTPIIQKEVKEAYSALTSALIPRLHGKQLHGIDFRSHHPIIATLFYYETFITQVDDPDALSVYVEWLFSLDEIFSQIIQPGGTEIDLVENNNVYFISGYYGNNQSEADHHQQQQDFGNDDEGSDNNDEKNKNNNDENNNDENNHDENNHDENNYNQKEQESVSGSSFVPDGTSFISTYLQAYLKPLTLHPVHAHAAELLLDSFSQKNQ